MYDVKRNITISEYLKQRVRDLTASPLDQLQIINFWMKTEYMDSILVQTMA